jgi:TniQ
MDWPLMLGPLPCLVAPFRDETITSYLRRLAGPNHIDPAGLRYLLARSDRTDAPVPLGRLAAITGMPGRSLACAMPQICTPAELAGLHIASRPRARDGWSLAACQACAAGQPVTRWALHDEVICCPHRRWISKDHEQPDLAAQPEILRAHRRHRRLIRRYGRDPVMRAVRDARRICIGWRLDGLADPGFGRRMEIFCGPGWQDRDDWAAQTSDAATYPQTIALARLLASPYWRACILGNHWAGHDEFTAELRRTVAPGYTWDYPPPRWRRGRGDPLLEWRLHTRRLKFEPLPPGHAWNLPETIQPAAAGLIAIGHAETPRDSDQRDDPVRQTVPST